MDNDEKTISMNSDRGGNSNSVAYSNRKSDEFLAAATMASTYNAEHFLKAQLQDYSAANNSANKFVAGFIALLLIGLLSLTSETIGSFYFVLACLIGGPISLFRLYAGFVAARHAQVFKSVQTDIAPVYTLLVAVYREASVISNLISSLEKIVWPKDKLDIIFICEINDSQTIETIKNTQTSLNYRLLCLPHIELKTKPRALQAGLGFAKGRFLAVYDAEDEPDPNQLRAAYEAFTNSDEKLAVVQAPLVAWNHRESWISGQFALEYAVWFRVILPALEKISNYLPLGGTSNHFRVSALKEVGGWDPYNVTEDADLGARLCRFGYKAQTIMPPTIEEAPPKIANWIRQRSRWMQGHIQTMAVHFRDTTLCKKQMGANSFIAFCLSITSGPLNVIMRLPMVLYSIYGSLFLDWQAIYLLVFGGFIVAEVLINIIAIVRDKRAGLLVFLLSLPIYWLLQIPAFWRATLNILRRPYYWEKTDHGDDARNLR